MRRILAQEETVIFVGSGISLWSDLPSWKALIGELASFLDGNDIDASLVRQEAGSGDLLQAASYGFAKLTPTQIGEFIRKACRSGAAVPGAIHQAIMKLGPNCFITTNYDDLLEQAYRIDRPPPTQLRTVLNTQLVEQADIVHAQAREFIFKPHGDARFVESVVLTREQYRKLMPEGQLSTTLYTLKTLLQSRPVLFLGFGLRDPDFLYLRDILANIYRGGMRDHYAIVADPVSDQVDYWRTNFGIHLIGYSTTDEGRDHTALLTLLRSLEAVNEQPEAAVAPHFDVSAPASVLALARYAASCLTPVREGRFEIRVEISGAKQRPVFDNSRYDFWPVKRLLLDGPRQCVLIGQPGAGKSFAIHEAVNHQAEALQDACLRGELNSLMRIPVAVDLKQYEGDLAGQIEAKFVDGLNLGLLHESFPVTLYLDGYNELPRNFREDGTFDRQLSQLLETWPEIGLIIGSRTTDGLERLELPAFSLSHIEMDEVETLLNVSGVAIPDRYRLDVVRVLQRPFYFRLLKRGIMSLDKVRTAGDLYSMFIENVRRNFEAKFGAEIDLIDALQRHAYSCLEQGREAFAIEDLVCAIDATAALNDGAEANEIVNWLASEEFIIPLQGRRAAFVHQSVTEYLAACELVKRLENQVGNADALLNLRRWDNAIYLALGMMPDSMADSLITEIASRDLTFALKAARFVEGSEALIEKLLIIILNESARRFDFEVTHAFENLPVSPSHENSLRKILDRQPKLKGEVLTLISKILGISAKKELVDRIFSENDYNVLRDVSGALSPFITPSDLQELIARLLTIEIEQPLDGDDENDARIGAIANAISGLPVVDVHRETLAKLDDVEPKTRIILSDILCRYCYERRGMEVVDLLIELMRRRLPENMFNVYICVEYDKEARGVFLRKIDEELIDITTNYLFEGDRWSVGLLLACADSGMVREYLLSTAACNYGIRRDIITYCATKDSSALFSRLASYASGSKPDADFNLLKLVDFSKLDWSGRHNLLISLLSLKNVAIARLVLGDTFPPSVTGAEKLEFEDVNSWLEWLIELTNLENDADQKDASWVADQLAFLIARSATPDTKSQLVAVLESGEPAEREAVAAKVLPFVDDLELADLSTAAVEFLISLVAKGQGLYMWRPHVFARIADEEFVRCRLFPLAVNGGRVRDLVDVLAQEVGKRLGVRIVLPAVSEGAAANNVSRPSAHPAPNLTPF